MTAFVEAAEAFFCRLGTLSIVMIHRQALGYKFGGIEEYESEND